MLPKKIINKPTMPEHQNIEYKSSWHDDYLKWICGFSEKIFGSDSRTQIAITILGKEQW